MKILTIGNFTTGWDGSICDEEHIAGALEELGHKVERYSRDNMVPDVDWLSGHHFTLIAQWDGYDMDIIQQLPKPLVYWAFDYQADGQEWHERLVAEADLYLSKRIADSKYPNWQWLPQDFSPSFLDKYPLPVKKDIDVLFTGSYLDWATERNQILKVVDEKFNLVIHSVNEWPGFKDQRGPIMDEGLPELYARAKVILSIDHTHEAGYWSDRNAQIMCCGGLVLFRHAPMSEIVFRRHVAYFDTAKECCEMIEDYLQRDEDREMFAQEGYEYAQQYLKVRNRVLDMLVTIRMDDSENSTF